MTVGYLLGAAVSDPDPRLGADLYEAYPVVRRTYAEIAEWTGIPAERILAGDFTPSGDHERFALTGIRLAAIGFGVHDLLADMGVRPGAVGGISLGGLVAASLAGALARRDLFAMLLREAETPPPPSGLPAQGAAIALVPAAEDPGLYHGERRPGVYLGGDFGVTADGAHRLLMLSGTREALDRLAAETPPGVVNVIDGQPFAVHSPLRRYAGEHMAPYVAALPLADPAVPLCSFLEQRTITTADGVRDLIARNKTETMSLVHVTAEMRRHGVEVAFVLGPTLPQGVIRFPFPVVHVTAPERVAEAVAALYEHGVAVDSPV